MSEHPDRVAPRTLLIERFCQLRGLDPEDRSVVSGLRVEADLCIQWLVDDHYITIKLERNAAGEIWAMHDPQLTPRALKLLQLWPSEADQARQHVERIAESLDRLANDATNDDDQSKWRAAAAAVRDGGIAIAANLTTLGITGI